jgi:hypothetical protein
MKLNKRNVLLIFLILSVLIIGILALISLIQHSFAPIYAEANTVRQGRLGITASLQGYGVYTYNYAKSLVAYSLIGYRTENALDAAFSLGMYSRNPVERIYLLNVTDYCYSCFDEGELYRNLQYYLGIHGLIMNASSFSYISFGQLASVVNGSVVIIPSGYIPVILLQNATQSSSYGLIALLKKGDTIVYVGDNFSKSAGLLGAEIYQSSAETLSALYDSGLGTHIFYYSKNTSQGTTPSGISYNSTNPLNLYFRGPTFNFSNGTIYGPLTYVNAFNGTIVAFPNLPSMAWNSTQYEARDIATVIGSRFWMNTYMYGIEHLNITNGRSGSIGIITFNKTMNTTNYLNVSFGSVINSSYGLAVAGVGNGTSLLETDMPFRLRFADNGTLGMPTVFGQNQGLPIFISIPTQENRQVVPHLEIEGRNMSALTSISLGFFNITPAISTVTKNILFDSPSGYYLALLKAFNNTYYSGAVFRIAGTNVTPRIINFFNQTFVFGAFSNGMPLNGVQYSINLNGTYAQNGTIKNGTIIYKLPSHTIVPYGTETFNIRILGDSYTYTTSYMYANIKIPVYYIEFGIAILLIGIINFFARAPDRDEYYVDVQEFRPVPKIKVSIKKAELINIFDKINFNYRWKYMPLTTEEIKNGIRENVQYNGTPVSTTLQNTSYVLNKLASDGDLIMSPDGYYAPAKWIAESKHGIVYLSIFRKLRDYMIEKAVLFTDLDKSDVADMVISRGGIKAHVIIYSEKAGSKEIKVTPSIKTFVVFSNEEARRAFIDKLYLSYGDDAERLRMSISFGIVNLIDTDNMKSLVF